jgi:tRNA A37 threonylcarbamoyladenosine modification protein TsaB
VRDGDVLGEAVSRAVRVLEDADELLRASGVERSELSAIVVGTGPGSFTGMRLGPGGGARPSRSRSSCR